jgi:hypothetical protein
MSINILSFTPEELINWLLLVKDMKRACFIAVILVLGGSWAVAQPGVSSAAEVRFKVGNELG